MVKTLQRHGTSVVLVFDEPMLEALHMDPDAPIRVTIHGLVITPADAGVEEPELQEAIERLRPRYAHMLEHLAN